MPQFPFSYISDLPSCSSLSTLPSNDPEVQYVLSVAHALPMLNIIPLPSGRIAVTTGHGSKTVEFSCSPQDLGPALSRVLHVRVDKAPAMMYDVKIESIPDIDIEL